MDASRDFATPPVLLLIFNRADTIRRVMTAVRRAAPSRLYVAGDGPRPSRPGEDSLCAEARRTVLDAVDWQCEVRTLFREENLGCRTAVSQAVGWFFAAEPEGIVLEDDCLPDPTFFRYCAELLERYRDDRRVGLIAGANFQFGRRFGPESYYFSRYAHIWGWAGWRRVWDGYDVGMTAWPEWCASGGLARVFPESRTGRWWWRRVLNAVHSGRLNTWDYQLNFSLWLRGMLGIIPDRNLVTNIGFGGEATHTAADSPYAGMRIEAMSFPLRHPLAESRNVTADAAYQRSYLCTVLLGRLRRELTRLLRRKP